MTIAYAETTSSAVTTTTTSTINLNAWDAILSASPVVQLTLLVLITMSVISWAILFSKKKQFQLMDEDNGPFLKFFWEANSLDLIYENIKKYPNSSLARVFKTGYLELQRIADSSNPKGEEGKEPKTPQLLSGVDNLQRSLNKAIDSEVLHLESRLSFLATTGSTGPFIGLFGTVWGIMGAFQKIGSAKSASLAVVAPGISEALIATAIGLAAAIPAVMAYNHFLTKLRRQELTLNNFAADFTNIVKRNFFKDS